MPMGDLFPFDFSFCLPQRYSETKNYFRSKRWDCLASLRITSIHSIESQPVMTTLNKRMEYFYGSHGAIKLKTAGNAPRRSCLFASPRN